jgi:hypothetical protein
MKSAHRSSSSILRRIAYPVEPFGFELVSGELPSPLLKGGRHPLWQQPDLFDQVNDGQAGEFK